MNHRQDIPPIMDRDAEDLLIARLLNWRTLLIRDYGNAPDAVDDFMISICARLFTQLGMICARGGGGDWPNYRARLIAAFDDEVRKTSRRRRP